MQPQLQSLSSLDRIRLLINRGPNYGTQAASVNLLRYLISHGFKGIVELIYTDSEKIKIANLLNIEEAKVDASCQYENIRIEFVELGQLLKKHIAGVLPQVTLGLTGECEAPTPYEALSFFSLRGWRLQANTTWIETINYVSAFLEKEAQQNFAIFLNVTSFVKFSAWSGQGSETRIFYTNNTIITQLGSNQKLIYYPPHRYEDALNYLLNNVYGKSLTRQLPELFPLLESINENKIHFIPAYGYPLQENINNTLRILSGARYAQLNGGVEFNKPMVVAIFGKIDFLQELISYRGFNEDYYIANLTSSAFHTIQNKNKTCLLLVDRLPQVVFNFIRNHPNVLSPIFEGVDSFNSLTASGRPHLHCKSIAPWTILSRHLTASLKNTFLELDEITCSLKNPSENSARILGEYFIASANSSSEVSQYFKTFQAEAFQEDRLFLGLKEVVQYEKTNPIISPQSRIYNIAYDDKAEILNNNDNDCNYRSFTTSFMLSYINYAMDKINKETHYEKNRIELIRLLLESAVLLYNGGYTMLGINLSLKIAGNYLGFFGSRANVARNCAVLGIQAITDFSLSGLLKTSTSIAYGLAGGLTGHCASRFTFWAKSKIKNVFSAKPLSDHGSIKHV